MKPLLQKAWQTWKRIAHRIGVVNTHILLFLFYFLIFGPFALVLRLFKRDMLEKKIPAHAETFWHPVEKEEDPASYRYPF